MRNAKALAVWGGGALLVTTIGTSTAVLANAAAASPSSGSASTTSNGNKASGGNNGNGAGNGSGTGVPGKALTVQPSVASGIKPGQTSAITVKVTNPNAQAVTLTSVTAAVTSVAPSSCKVGWFTVTPSTAPTSIAAGGFVTVSLPLTLAETGTNQDVCKNASYTFTSNVTANQA